MEYVHYPVMGHEILHHLVVGKTAKPFMVDCTCGEGGHTHPFSRLSKADRLGLDRESAHTTAGYDRMKEFSGRFIPKNICSTIFLTRGEQVMT
jgi:16S rRNA (cytosine1402-N4)-methyltransferase